MFKDKFTCSNRRLQKTFLRIFTKLAPRWYQGHRWLSVDDERKIKFLPSRLFPEARVLEVRDADIMYRVLTHCDGRLDLVLGWFYTDSQTSLECGDQPGLQNLERSMVSLPQSSIFARKHAESPLFLSIRNCFTGETSNSILTFLIWYSTSFSQGSMTFVFHFKISLWECWSYSWWSWRWKGTAVSRLRLGSWPQVTNIYANRNKSPKLPPCLSNTNHEVSRVESANSSLPLS